MRSIGVLTTSRADYSSLRPLIKELIMSEICDPALIVSGTHLSARHGETIWEIEADGFPIAAKVPLSMDDDSPTAVARSMGEATSRFADALDVTRPDILLILGDRFEVHAAASAATPLLVPLAHLHGGELSLGAIDDSLRHSITKLSHLHFVSTEGHAARVRQMGEESWRVTVSGAPTLDNLGSINLMSRAQLSKQLGVDLNRDPLAVTYHPPTLEPDARELDGVLEALDGWEGPIVVTAPNADPGNLKIRAQLKKFANERTGTVFVEDLGPNGYFSLLSIAAAMVGNSSSGIIEAPSFGLPVVNVGNRQGGRETRAERDRRRRRHRGAGCFSTQTSDRSDLSPKPGGHRESLW